LSQSIVTRSPSPLRAVAGLILSMALVATGSGLMFTFIPVKLGQLGYAPSTPGWILTAMATGGFVGCLYTGRLVKRVGHARTYMTLAALTVLSHVTLAVTDDPWLWAAARMIYGFAVTGLFIVSQSWLNDASPNDWRGRVMAVFYMSYVLCIGAGGYLVGQIDLSTARGPVLAVGLVALAMLPVGTTILRAPAPPEHVSIALSAVWRISPVGLAGLFAVGGLTMLVQGFAPIYAQASGYSQGQIGLLVFLMQLGMIAVQLPLGALSDRIDRRIVLLIAACLILVFAFSTSLADGVQLWLLIVLFGAWAGATETIYAVANAHANDRAQPEYFVSVSTTMLFAWSFSGFVIPGVASLLTPLVGVKAFMYIAMAIAAVYGLFVVYRMLRMEPPADEHHVPYEPRAAQAAYAPELAAPLEEEVKQEVPQ
jgi:MFS family permease